MSKTKFLIVFILIANISFSQTPYDERILVNHGLLSPTRDFVPNYMDAFTMALELVGLDPKNCIG